MLDDWPIADFSPLVLIFPSPLDERQAGAFVVILEASVPVPGDAEHAEAVARCRTDIVDEQREITAAMQRVVVSELAAAELRRKFRQLESVDDRRSAVLFLAIGTRAELAADIALIGSDEVIDRFAEQTVRLGRDDPVQSAEAVRWRLERMAYVALAEANDREALSTGLRAVLLRYTGEVGRFPAMLLDAAEDCKDQQAMSAWLIEANRGFLESSSPASRVRAYDWLAAQDLAPADYDPFGPLDERRAALERSEAGGEIR